VSFLLFRFLWTSKENERSRIDAEDLNIAIV